MSSSLCYSQGKMMERSGACRNRLSSSLTGFQESVEKMSCTKEGISPILVGIITALVTALVTGLVVMAMMRLACSPESRVEEGGKREA